MYKSFNSKKTYSSQKYIVLETDLNNTFTLKKNNKKIRLSLCIIDVFGVVFMILIRY